MAMSRSLGGRSLTARSPMEISPAVISSRPATMRRVVDLPQPDGPTSTMNSLSRMWRLTSLTACTSSYFLFRSFISTCAMASSPSMESPESGAPGAGWLTPASALDGAGEARHVVFHEERIDEGHRDGAEQRSRHELAPEVDVAADQLRDHPHRHRLALRRGQEHERVDELVPGQGEGEDTSREDPRHRDGKDDPHHGPEARGPVDACTLLELAGDGLEVAHEQPRAEGNEEGRVGEDERPRGVAELEVADDVGEGNEEQGRGHQVRHEDGGAEDAGHGEAQAAQRVAGQQATEERDDGGDGGDEERVPQPVRKRRLGHQGPEVLEGGLQSPERRVVGGAPGTVQLGVGPDGGDEHPVEGEQGADDEDGEGNVEEDPPLPRSLDDHVIRGPASNDRRGGIEDGRESRIRGVARSIRG